MSSLFKDLWLTRMLHPDRVLKMLLALEAYRLAGDYDREFAMSELLLDKLRSKDVLFAKIDAYEG
jgi:hypothetical protein